MKSTALNLPLAASPRTWNDLTLLGPLQEPADAAPEPDLPQGEYSSVGQAGEVAVPVIDLGSDAPAAELLAPAGGPDAAFAALHYGADAIYLGLKKFSARAEAENFTLDELSEVTAFAHSLTPARRVFVTINTVIRQDELGEMVETLAHLADIGVDAVILQDLGVYHLLRQHFPELELHASTQLAVHNAAGARVLRQLGFERVVLARELTFEEVRDITSASGIETEVFIHGALCYSYSGLCLFSSQTLGRSGNRGKCAYSCRDAFSVSGAPDTLRDGTSVKRDPSSGFAFSMKDLALPDHLPMLRAAGVSCFKIEGRKKSPLYVATTTDYYRKLLDGRLTAEDRGVQEAELQSVFSRPWTRLFVDSHRDKEVADRDTVGHRGTRIGQVDSIRRVGRSTRLRFHTDRDIQRHDGLQVDLPILGKPFGFPVDELWLVQSSGKTVEEFEAPAGAIVEVGLPAEHPEIPRGAPVYCSSSQAVKQKYRCERPRSQRFRVRRPVRIEIHIGSQEAIATGRIVPRSSREEPIEVVRTLAGPFQQARSPESMESAVRTAFEKLGDTRLSLESVAIHNPAGLFVPVSRLNQLRRDLAEGLESALADAFVRRCDLILRSRDETRKQQDRGTSSFRWSMKVDRSEYLDALEACDWDGLDEVVIDIARDHPTMLEERLTRLADTLGRERIRLALPALTRKWEEKGLRHKIDRLLAAGWRKWETANLAAWDQLGLDASTRCSALDLSTDWSIYVLNRFAAQQLLAMGVTRFALSPEDGLANLRSLLQEFGQEAVVIVYQDTPLFVAESCAYANLIGGCPGKANCSFEKMDMVSSHGERVTALDYHCRTIVLNQGPFCLSTHLPELARAGAGCLRADFIYRHYAPEEVREAWRTVRAGRRVAGGHAANFRRGME